MELLSMVVPCHDEQETLEEFYQAICLIREQLLEEKCLLEVILVDDGSKADALDRIKAMARKQGWIGYLALTKSFGWSAAAYAGLQQAAGDYVYLHALEERQVSAQLLQLLTIVREGVYDCAAHKKERMMSRRYVNSLLELAESSGFSEESFEQVGYQTKWMEKEQGKANLLRSPMRIVRGIGVLLCGLAVLVPLLLMMQAESFRGLASAWSLPASLILLVGGIQLCCLGVIGEYLFVHGWSQKPIYLCKERQVEKLALNQIEAEKMDKKNHNKKKKEKKAQGKHGKGKDIYVVWPEEEKEKDTVLSESAAARMTLEKYGWKDDESDSSVSEEEEWDD